jgi:group I intron endonuclease
VSRRVIYKILNTANGKFYVGSTMNTRERFRNHRKMLRSNKHHCKHLQASWNKYGEQTFIFHIVETVPEEQSLQAAEDRWLTDHVGKPHCYNTGYFSDAPWRGAPKEIHPQFGKPKSEETKQAIAGTLKEFYAEDPNNHPRRGKKHTEEARRKMSEGIRAAVAAGRAGKFIPSEETRKKMSESQKGNKNALGYKRTEAEREAIRQRTLGNQHWLGRSHTAETRAKTSLPVVAALPDGTVQEYFGLSAMREALGITVPTIIRACRSGKPIAKGKFAGWRIAYKNRPPQLPVENLAYSHDTTHTAGLILMRTDAPPATCSEWPRKLEYLGAVDGVHHIAADTYYIPEDLETALCQYVRGKEDLEMFWRAVDGWFPLPTVRALRKFAKQFKEKTAVLASPQ